MWASLELKSQPPSASAEEELTHLNAASEGQLPKSPVWRDVTRRGRICSTSTCIYSGVAVAIFLALAAVWVSVCQDGCSSSGAKTDRPQAVTTPENDHIVTLLLVGDWGRGPNCRKPAAGDSSAAARSCNQTAVADRLAAVARQLQPEFVISTGDNFYPGGLKTQDDARFTDTFTDMYHHSDLQVPWHAVLGNHDYGDGHGSFSLNGDGCFQTQAAACDQSCCFSPSWQLQPHLSIRDSRWHCERTYDMWVGDGALQAFFLFVDTTPAVARYRSENWAQFVDGVNAQDWPSQLQDIEARLKAAHELSPRWMFVVGHHPVYSNGDHGDTVELVDQLRPLLHKYRVQAYFNGHDHDLQLIRDVSDKQIRYITTGAGSYTSQKAVGCDTPAACELQEFYTIDGGFVSLEIGTNDAQLNFWTHLQEDPVHTLTMPSEL